jgi:hypothetical protein
VTGGKKASPIQRTGPEFNLQFDPQFNLKSNPSLSEILAVCLCPFPLSEAFLPSEAAPTFRSALRPEAATPAEAVPPDALPAEAQGHAAFPTAAALPVSFPELHLASPAEEAERIALSSAAGAAALRASGAEPVAAEGRPDAYSAREDVRHSDECCPEAELEAFAPVAS